MFTFRRTIAAAAATIGLFASSAATAASPAAKLSIVPSAGRASAPAGQSKLGASVSTATLISVGILAAFAVIVLATTGDDDSDSK